MNLMETLSFLIRVLLNKEFENEVRDRSVEYIAIKIILFIIALNVKYLKILLIYYK